MHTQRTMAKGKVLTQRFNQLLPGAHSNFSATPEVRVFQSRAKGSRIWDVDGNEYIDYTGASGPNILGHSHPEYIESLQAFMQEKSLCTGASFLFSEEDIAVAEKLVKHIPCAEQVKFCVSGSEAVQQAIRLARAYTGKHFILRFGAHYHGWTDNIYGGAPDPSPLGIPYPLFQSDDNGDELEFEGLQCPKTNMAGKSEKSNYEGLMIPWNNIEALRTTLQTYHDQIAIIIMEAIACNNGAQFPKLGYLEEVRELCNHYGIVLCFDEVVTGFRVGLNGAQGLFGVTPDICTLGKALGAGLPISAVVGKAELISQFTDAKVLGPGTFNGNPLCIHAVKTTLEILERDDGSAYDTMDRIQRLLTNGLDEIAKRRGIPLRIQGPTGIFCTLFGVDPDKEQFSASDMEGVDEQMNKRFHKLMLDEGVNSLFGRWFPSIVHTEQDVSRVLESAEKSMQKL